MSMVKDRPAIVRSRRILQPAVDEAGEEVNEVFQLSSEDILREAVDDDRR